MAELPFDVVVNDDGSATVKRFADNTDKSMKRVGDAGARGSKRISSAFNKMKRAALGVRGSLGKVVKSAASLKNLLVAGIGTAILVKGFKTLTAAAVVQEDAINRLNAALRIAGEFSEEASADFQAFAGQLQRTTKFGDETILEVLALSKAFGFTAKQAKVATRAATELSVAAGIELTEAMRRVGRTISGSIADVSKFAPEIKKLTKSELAAGKAADKLVEALGGSAAAQIETFSGRTTQLNNNFGDLVETFGFMIIKSDDLRDSIGEVSLGIDAASNAIREIDFTGLGDDISAFLPTANLASNAIFFMANSLIGLRIAVEFTKGPFQVITDAVGLTTGAVDRNIETVDQLVATFDKLIIAEIEAEQAIRLHRVEQARLASTVNDTSKALITQKGVLEEVARATEDLIDTSKLFKTPAEDFVDFITKSKEDAKELQQQIGQLRKELGLKPPSVVEGFFDISALEAEQDRLVDISIAGVEEELRRRKELRDVFKVEAKRDFEAEAEEEIERRSRLRGLILEGEELFLQKIGEFENKQTAIKFKNEAARLDIASKFLAAGNSLAQTFGSKNVEIQKGIAIAQATVSTAVAVVNALASGGIAGPNFALAAAVAAVGAAQIAAIAAARPGAGAVAAPGEAGAQGGFGGGVEPLREIPVEATTGGPTQITINVTGFIGEEAELASELGRVLRQAVGDDVAFGFETDIR